MTEAPPRYAIAALTLFTATILERAGLREADAEVSADPECGLSRSNTLG
jgi:hypothetical protein